MVPSPHEASAAAPLLPPSFPDGALLDQLMLQANRARVVATLARGVTHDLRNPLQTLSLMSVEGPGGNPEFSAIVGNAVERLAETVTRFSRIYSPVDRDREPIVVADLLTFVQELEGLQRSLPPVPVDRKSVV